MKSAFSPKSQETNDDNKLFTVLYSFSDSFRILFWRFSKDHGLSPLQIQLLIFITNHKSEHNKISYLSNEFNMTKPTISDAVKTLIEKGLLLKELDSKDARSFSLMISEQGKKIVIAFEEAYQPMINSIKSLEKEEKVSLFVDMMSLINRMDKSGIRLSQRMCYNCSFYQSRNEHHYYCRFLEKEMQWSELRIDCNEHESIDLS